MLCRGCPHGARSHWSGALLVGVLLVVGCQSYQSVPLDLEQYKADAASRLNQQGNLRAFLQRLNGDTDQAGSFDLDDGIDAAEAEVIALFYNPDLRLARLNAGAALANAETAGLWEDPVFGFDGEELISPSGPFEYGLTVSWTLPVSGRLAVEQDRADAAYHAELKRLVDAEWSMRSRVRAAWATWSVANERMELVDQLLREIDRVSVVSDRLEELGELSRAEVRLLHAERLAVRVERASAVAEVERARLDLLGLMGLLPDTQITLATTPSVVSFPEISNPVERLIRTNTSLAALRAEYQVAEQALRLEVRKQYPDIEIGAGFGSEDNDDRLLLGASLPIPVFNANRGGIADARADRDLARAAAETGFERLALVLASTQARLEATEQQRRILELELVPMLDEQSAELDRLAELGEVDTLILLEIVTRRFEAKNRILDLYHASLRDRIEVMRLLGPADTIIPVPVSDKPYPETPTGHRESARGDSP